MLLSGLSDTDVQRLGEGHPLVYDDAVDQPTWTAWARVLAELHDAGELSRAGVGRARDSQADARDDRTTWLADVRRPGMPHDLHASFERLRLSINRSAWLGLRDFEVQLACFPGDGARYVRHRDAFRDLSRRRLTAILYLNEAWRPDHGGALRLHGPEDVVDIEPLGGRLVLFLSEGPEHEVRPTFARRLAATAWFRS